MSEFVEWQEIAKWIYCYFVVTGALGIGKFVYQLLYCWRNR